MTDVRDVFVAAYATPMPGSQARTDWRARPTPPGLPEMQSRAAEHVRESEDHSSGPADALK